MSKRQYTGPTGAIIKDGNFHIEGYPDARRVVKLDNRLGKKIADLRLHQHDLQFCEHLLQIFCNVLTDPPDVLSEGLWIAVLTKFYSCFGDNRARSSLDPKKVLNGNNEALRAFWFYKNMRNKNIVHDENNYNLPLTGVVLGENEEVQDVLSLVLDFEIISREQGQNIYNLIDTSSKYVESQIAISLKDAFAELSAMPKEQRARMSDLKITAPVDGDEQRGRTY